MEVRRRAAAIFVRSRRESGKSIVVFMHGHKYGFMVKKARLSPQAV
jgi:esterase/lipase superfamily enzyme